MRIALLTGENGGGWHGDDLLRAAKAAGHEVTPCWWESLRAAVGAGSNVSPQVPLQTSSVASSQASSQATYSGSVRLDNVDAVLARAMPAATLEQVVFRMDVLHRAAAAGAVVINPPRAIEMAVDKYLALARAAEAGIATPPTIACQRAADAKRAFHQLGGDVVLKPVFGSEGFGLTRISDEAMASRAFAQLQRMGSVIYLQAFVPHEEGDFRLFVIGGRVVAAMRRTSDDWRTNVARGGKAQAIDPEPDLVQMAIGACEACGVWVGGVDIVRNPAGAPLLLEVNAAPGWRRLGSVTGVDIATEIIALTEREVKRRSAGAHQPSDETSPTAALPEAGPTR